MESFCIFKMHTCFSFPILLMILFSLKIMSTGVILHECMIIISLYAELLESQLYKLASYINNKLCNNFIFPLLQNVIKTNH